MQGYKVTFFTEQDRKHKGQMIADWLLAQAKEVGVSGATVIVAEEGFGREGKLHSAHFFELADVPVEVTMVVSDANKDKLIDKVKEAGLGIFYVINPVEYGTL
ncbi:DUF190 domain-containing protein [Gallaecimonas mangrovi]|uniref:DUF190 domain-containing protein n=1 Tax=Gallaecimonas mangrovi TaxID=2291597 RepID=UPI000E207B3F|nr:DUF190 domain-containing protein [Gallaecimonas mangrovi]